MRTKSLKSNKKLILLISIVALFVVTAGATLAYIVTQTDGVRNVFNPSHVTCEVQESFDKSVKKDVNVKNTGDTDAYIRAYIVVNWVDETGNIAAEKPAENDYSITFSTGTAWKEYDGYYYYTKSVAPKASTADLIKECRVIGQKDGYSLQVEIIADAVQSSPADAVKDAWGVTVDDNGKISAPSGSGN